MKDKINETYNKTKDKMNEPYNKMKHIKEMKHKMDVKKCF